MWPRVSFCVSLSLCLRTTLVTCQYYDSVSAQDLISDFFGLPFQNATFDYVVIGGGTAGLTIANRLSENGSLSVAVVEAGGWYEFNNGNWSQIPAYAAASTGTEPLVRNNLVDWGYTTQQEPALKRSIFYNSGKAFGGGSARNYMVYTRGTRGSYQRWADEVNDQSYTFENLLLFYQKSINFQGTNTNARPQNATLQSDPSSFGQGGPIQVCYPNWANTISSFVQQGLQELGFDIRPDFVSGDLIGQQYISFQIELSSQTRSSFEVAYLGPALNSGRKLTLYENTLVKKILFDDQKRANGVLVDSAGTQYSLRAKNEVILSAGAHRSPQLLTVSGVGPSATLNDFGVPVLSDLAGVGQNLQDQPFYGPSYPVGLETHNSLSLSPEFVLEQVLAYRQNRTGFLTNPGSDYLAYEKLPEPYRSNLRPETRDALDQFPSDWPEVLYTVVDAYSGDGRFPIAATPLDGRRFATILLSLVAPLSRGNVTINSTDTADNPVITSGLISDPRDQDVAVQAFKRIRKIVNTTAVQSVVTGPEEFPGLNVTSDDDILQAIRYGVSPIWHASSTNKMGVAGDQMAVVDSEAKVFGVQALRVVDVSAFPFLPPQHPSSLVYALAEKIADNILHGQQ